MERAVVTDGLELLGWRDVPVDNTTIGKTARSVEPVSYPPLTLPTNYSV